MSPKVQPFSFPLNLNINSRFVVVSCILLSGDRPVSFKWLKNGQSLSVDSDRVIIKNDESFSVLEIRRLESQDVGNYTCRAHNSFGKDEKSSQLIIKCKKFVTTNDTLLIVSL